MEVNFNSNEYIWADIIVVLPGHEVTDLRGVGYKVKSQMEALFASGREARGIQRGRRECEGTIILLQSELVTLGQAVQKKDYENISNISSGVIVSYVPTNGVVTTDKIIGVSSMEISRGMKEGGLKMEVALLSIVLDVVSNVLQRKNINPGCVPGLPGCAPDN